MRGDERIRTAEQAPGANLAYEGHKFGGVRPELHPKGAATPSIQRRVETTVTRGRTYGGRLWVHPRTRITVTRLGGAELGPAATVNAEKPQEATWPFVAPVGYDGRGGTPQRTAIGGTP